MNDFVQKYLILARILKSNLEKKSRLFFKILAKYFLNKIIDFTIYLYGGAKRPVKSMILFKNILARILKNNLVFFSRLFFKIILPKSCKIILQALPVAAMRGGFGGAEAPPDDRNVFTRKYI